MRLRPRLQVNEIVYTSLEGYTNQFSRQVEGLLSRRGESDYRYNLIEIRQIFCYMGT